MGVVGLAENKANSAPIELELELGLNLAIFFGAMETFTANGGSSMDTCQNCKPWQFYGHFSEFMYIVAIHCEDFAWYKTANGGSSMDTFRSCGNPVIKLYFLKTPKSVHRTATVCSFGKCP